MQLVGRADLAPGSDRAAGRLHEPAFGDPVLGADQRVATGTDRPAELEGANHVGRHVLEFVGHDGGDVGQPHGRADVVVRAQDDLVGDGRRRAVRIGIEHGHPVAQRAGRLGEHPTELAPAQDPDDRRRRDRASPQPGTAVDIGDPGLFAVGVVEALLVPAGHDLRS